MNGKQIVALVIGTLASGCSFPHAIPTDSLQNRLNDLAREKTTPPEDIHLAMCYYVAEPKSVEATVYHCPTCGTKTRYASMKFTGYEVSEQKRDQFHQRERYHTLVENRKEYKTLIDELRTEAANYGLKLSLDETDMCPHCHQKQNTDHTPSLYLVIEKQDGSTARTPCTYNRLQLLRRFLASVDWKANRYSDNTTIRDDLGDIEDMLGMKSGS